MLRGAVVVFQTWVWMVHHLGDQGRNGGDPRCPLAKPVIRRRKLAPEKAKSFVADILKGDIGGNDGEADGSR